MCIRDRYDASPEAQKDIAKADDEETEQVTPTSKFQGLIV